MPELAHSRATSAEGHRLLVLPRRATHVSFPIGEADAFVAGFVAARCRHCSTAQALLWAHAAGVRERTRGLRTPDRNGPFSST